MAAGFFTDTTLCIGCKACEVACKQWNELPADGYRVLGELVRQHDGARRHHLAARRVRRTAGAAERAADGEPLADDERRLQTLHARRLPRGLSHGRDHAQRVRRRLHPARRLQRLRLLRAVLPVRRGRPHRPRGQAGERFASDGRTGNDALQHTGGVAGKCTLCYDRQRIGLEPACAKACPTDSIQFGDVAELKARARLRVASLRERGVDARLYGVDETTSVGDLNAFFLLTDRPEVYNLPARPVLPSTHQTAGYVTGALAAVAMGVVAAFVFGRDR